jgi:cell division GTPase FtsZ
MSDIDDHTRQEVINQMGRPHHKSDGEIISNTGDVEMNDETGNEEMDDFTIDDGFLDIPDIPLMEEDADDKENIEDECKVAFKFAFIGTGQAGARIAEAFWNLGYRRVCVVNTTDQDLKGINIPDENKFIMDVGEGGAGKDPAKGKNAAETYYEDLYDLMRRCFGKNFDRIFVCAGSGGGTGTGSCDTIIKIAHDIAENLKIETKGGQPAVGAIVSMPMKNESKKVNANSLTLLDSLFGQVGDHKGKLANRTLSPLVVIDNQKITEMYPSLPVTQFWPVANKSVTALFHLFNSIAAQDSDFTTFDRADFGDMLESGVVSFGACPIKQWKSSTDISYAIRDNLKKTILASNFDIRNASAAACVFVGNKSVLDEIPQAYLEHGFDMLSRLMGDNSVLHRGIYKGGKPGLVVYSMLGELSKPEERMAEIKAIGSS